MQSSCSGGLSSPARAAADEPPTCRESATGEPPGHRVGQSLSVPRVTGESQPELRVGGRTVKLAQAEEWIRTYTDAATNRSIAAPYAFPAYDHFDASSDSDHLSDGDLLAPGLLNVNISISSFYGLQRIRPELERHLRAIPGDLCLEVADDAQVQRLVSPIYAVLDSPTDRPRKVKATKLSKVLHRKRPHFLVLHDAQVQNCYREPLHIPTPGRSWANYMVELSLAVAHDLRTQRPAWDHLAAAVSSEGPISRVRLLDIVAWRLGK